MSHPPSDRRVTVVVRFRMAAKLVAGLRGHDFRAAATFMREYCPAGSWPARLVHFLRWAVRQTLVVIPAATTGLSFARHVSRTPIWLAGGNPLANHPWNGRPGCQLAKEAAVVVIGAGFTGASLAFHWSKAGVSNRRMIVLEMDDPASGASGRNEGLVVMGRHFALVCDTVGRYLRQARADLNDRDRAQLARQFAAVYCRAAYKNADLIEDTIKTERFECDYARRGWVQVRDREAQGELEASVDMTAGAGFSDWTKISPSDASARTGMHAQQPAGFSVRAATFHPAKWTWSLLHHAISRCSVDLYTRTKVLGVEHEGEDYLVRTSRGAIRARYVVNALESHTALLHPRLRNSIWPVQSQAAFGEGGPAQLKPGIGVSGPLFFCGQRGPGVTFGSDATRVRQRHAGRNLPSRFLTTFAVAEMNRHFGPFALHVSHEWSGTAGFTMDEYPIVGPLDGNRQYVIAGMCGSGTAVSFNAARQVVHQILGLAGPDDYPEAYFSPRRLLDPAHHVWPVLEVQSGATQVSAGATGSKGPEQAP